MTRRSGDKGSATAELAVALPVIVVLVAAVAGAGAVGRAQVDCRDAAWTAARMVARGDEVSSALAAADQVRPDGARVSVTDQGDTIVVEVRAGVRLGGLGQATVPVGCRAVAVKEVP